MLDQDPVDRLFTEFEANQSAGQCGDVAEHLAGSLFRFMMLDESLLSHSLASACDSNRVP